MLWGEQSWIRIAELDRGLPVIIPLGSCEQHGPDLVDFEKVQNPESSPENEWRRRLEGNVEVFCRFRNIRGRRGRPPTLLKVRLKALSLVN